MSLIYHDGFFLLHRKRTVLVHNCLPENIPNSFYRVCIPAFHLAFDFTLSLSRKPAHTKLLKFVIHKNWSNISLKTSRSFVFRTVSLENISLNKVSLSRSLIFPELRQITADYQKDNDSCCEFAPNHSLTFIKCFRASTK